MDDGDGTGLRAPAATERDRTEVELRAREERLRLAVAATGLGIFDWDLTTDLVTVNARFREMLGLPPGGDVIGAAMLGGVVHPEDQAFVEARLGEAFDPGSSGAYQFEHRALTPHGEIWLLTFGQVYFADDGSDRRAVRVIGNDLDISERKRAEAERERLFAELQEQALELELSNQQLQDQALELELTNQQLQDNAAELEAANEELQSTTEELAERTAAAEQAGHALAESERQFRTLADAIPTLAWTARADGYIDWYNQRWYAYTGTTPAQMEGWGWQSVHDPAALPGVMARWTASIASGDPFEMTFPLRGADGGFRRFLTRVMPVHDAEGRVLRWFGTNTDVESERLAREIAERAATRTALLQSLTDALSRAVTREDVASVVVDRVAAALGAHLAVLALVAPDGEHLAVAAGERLTLETRHEWSTFPLTAGVPLAEAAYEGRTVTLSTFDDILAKAPAVADICRAYGTQALCAIPVKATTGEVVGAMGLSFSSPREVDSDEQALLETLAQQAAQALERARHFEAAQTARAEAERQRAVAEAANAAKSQFLSTMSHELRTPLNAIAGYTQLLTMGLRGPVTDLQQEDLKRIDRASQYLMGLVTDVLNFARIDAGQIEFQLADVELATVVGDVEPLIRPQLVAKGLAFDHDGCAPDTPDTPHRVRADPEKLRQILLNLLTNAVKFTGAGGQVSLACETDRTLDVVRVRVSDTGRGIPADQLDRIFEPFIQIDRHRTHDSQQGVGLGLAISRDLARGMGGDLSVESEEGRGSTFTLILRRSL